MRQVKATKHCKLEPEPKHKGSIQVWAEKVGWNHRVKAVCKPCWEIKYCPYGPLVEEFPITEEGSERSCRIFGHDCPVFTVAEPLTETKELRRITRTIPRPLQFRVLKRDNQICRECGKSVQDDDIHFDHIIPWAKGGPTEEHNIRLLCSDCNRKKSDNYEDKYLVTSFTDHVIEPVDIDFVEFLRRVAADGHIFRQEHGFLPDGGELAKWFEVDKVTDAENHLAQDIADLDEFFTSNPPSDVPTAHYNALRYRWGWDDGKPHKVSETVARCGVSEDDLLDAELGLMRRLGWRVELSASQKKHWLNR